MKPTDLLIVFALSAPTILLHRVLTSDSLTSDSGPEPLSSTQLLGTSMAAADVAFSRSADVDFTHYTDREGRMLRVLVQREESADLVAVNAPMTDLLGRERESIRVRLDKLRRNA